MLRLKFRQLLILLILFVLNNSALHAQKWEWAQIIRPGGNEYVWDVTNDLQGNVIATGRVKATSIFGWPPNTVTPPWHSNNQTDAFLVKYRPNGELVWAKRDGGKEQDWGRGLVTDSLGNIFVTGEFRDTAYFVNKVIYAVTNSATIANMYLAKYDSTGNCIWVAQAGNAKQSTIGHGVTIDDAGNIYTTGFVNDISDFGNGIKAGVAGKHLSFVAKYSPLGVCQWVKVLNTTSYGNGNDIKYSKSGYLYITGEFKGTLTVNGTQYKSIGTTYEDIYTGKMDLNGNFIWARIGNGSQTDLTNRVDIDKNDNVYVVGQFETTMKVESASLVANAFNDGFVIKYDKNGSFKWAVGLLGAGSEYLSDVKVYNNNDIIISGHVAVGDFNLSQSTINCPNSSHIVASLDSLGKLSWYKLAGPNGSSTSKGVTFDGAGNIFSAGFYDDYVELDTIVFNSGGEGNNGLVCKLFPPLQPKVTSSNPQICFNNTIQYHVEQPGSPLTYKWSFPGGTPATSTALDPLVSYSTPGIYNVQLITKNHHETDTLFLTSYVTVNGLPNVNLGPDAIVCSGTSIQLNAGSGMISYLWNDGSTKQTLDVSTGGTYFVTVANACASASDTIKVDHLTAPFVYLGADTSICENNSLTLNAGSGMSIYTWNTGQHTQEIVVSSSGKYFVTVTGSNGCSSSDTLNLTTTKAPVVVLAKAPEICKGASFTFDAGAGQAQYKWNDQSTQQTLTAKTEGNYFVTVTDGSGCSASDTSHLTVHALPVVDLGTDVSGCENQSYVLDAGAGMKNYLWNNGSTAQTLTVTSTGTYSVSVGDANGCSSSDTINTKLYPLPSISLGKDTILCKPEILVLDPGSGYKLYKWSDGSENPTLPVDASGNYYVTVTDQHGCSASDSIKVSIEICTEIENESQQLQVIIYPNPATDHIMLNIQDIHLIHNRITFKMFNALGVNVLSQQVTNAETSLSVEGLAPANYIYQLEVDGVIVKRGKIIIQ